ncbi:MAG: hypothetical protein CK424_06210 [Legionella sp.]|nr:MAG: hypothetical protein CK424_06210 [Legionella sp.]
MFYTLKDMPKGLLNACVVPRPIAWISSVSKFGIPNLAPFSYFNIVCENPAMVLFSTTKAHIEGGPKDTLKNIEETGEFVINIVTLQLMEAMNLTSASLLRAVNEFDFANIDYEPSHLIHVPRVKDSPIHLECEYHDSIQLPSDSEKYVNKMVIGKVKGIHVNPSVMTDGFIDLKKMQLIARVGYGKYLQLGDELISMPKADTLL